MALIAFLGPPSQSRPVYAFPSINQPIELEANFELLNSDTTITPRNVGNLVQAAQARFSPWELATALAWSPDGKYLAVAAGERIHLIDVTEWRRLGSFPIGSLTQSLTFSQDGNWLAVGSRDGLVRCWFKPLSLKYGAAEIPPSTIFQAHKKGVNHLAFSPDGRVLASGGNDAVARFWDLETSQTLGLMIGGTYAVPSIAFSPQGDVLAVANGRMVRLRQVGSERILGSFQADEPLFSLAYSSSGSWLAAGDISNGVLLWRPEQAFRSGQEKYPQPTRLLGHNGRSGTYRALIWDVAFNHDGQLLASAGGDMSIRLWDVDAAVLLSTLLGHTAAATEARFNPDSTALASSGLDGRLIVWKIASGE